MDDPNTIKDLAVSWLHAGVSRDIVLNRVAGRASGPQYERKAAAQRALAIYVYLRDEMQDPNAASSFYHEVMGL